MVPPGLPDAQLRIIERAGHNPQIERPAETLAAVADFLAIGSASNARPQVRDATTVPLETAGA